MRTTDFITMERGLWQQGGAYFTATAMPTAWFVMPPPIGIVNMDGALRYIASGVRWSWVDILDTRIDELKADAKLLIYRATARKDGVDPYYALCSSTYIFHRKRWRLTHHQQTIASAPGA